MAETEDFFSSCAFVHNPSITDENTMQKLGYGSQWNLATGHKRAPVKASVTLKLSYEYNITNRIFSLFPNSFMT
jgi:hypothetical protein